MTLIIQKPTTSKLILAQASVSVATHPEAADWQNRVAANGGTVSSTTFTAVNVFCQAINNEAGLRAAISRLNLFCGGNLNACLVPLYLAESFGAAAKGNTTDTNNGPFVSGDYVETGATGGLSGGSTKYLDTGLPHNQVGSSTTGHLSFSGNNLPNADAVPAGAYNGAAGSLEDINLNPASNTTRYRFGSFTGPDNAFSATRNHFIGTTSGGTGSVYSAGALVNTAPTGTLTRSTRTYYVFALNVSGTVGALMSGRLRMYSIGNSLTASQAAAFSTAVANFNTALSRT
jgi:hypothetical protein